MNLPGPILRLAALCFAHLIGWPAEAVEEPMMVRSAGDGEWSEPATWEAGRVPATGDRVQIRGGLIRIEAGDIVETR